MNSLNLKYSSENWIKKAKKIHKNKFNYSKTVYRGSREQINIICKKHGAFKLRASHHLEGSGCRQCNIERQRKSKSQFIKDSKIYHGNHYNYSLVEFKSIHDFVKIICPIHGTFKQKPSKHQKGQGCKKCNKGEVWNTKDFVKKAIIVHKNRFNYSKVKYRTTDTKVKIICKKCKNIFMQRPGSHLRGVGCVHCAGKIPISEEMFKEILKDVHSDKIILLSKYKNKTLKVKVQCTCGNVWLTTPNHLIKRKQGCRRCSVLKKTMTNKVFKKRLKDEHNGNIIPLENYKMSRTRIKFKCLKCGKKYKSEPRNVLRNGCHSCANRKDYKEFNSELKKVHFGEIIPIDKYKTHRDRILVKHKCGYMWKAVPSDLIGKKAHGCPLCAKSWGNKKIYHFLDKNKISFETEKRFSSCKYKIPMPFDFYLTKKKILIEYDGEQHFMAIDFWGGKKGLDERILKDKIKDDWAKKNKIKLFRIKYDENINQKMNEIIKLG